LHPLDDEIPIGHGVHRIFAYRQEAEFRAEEFSIEGVRVSSECGGTEGEN